MFSATRRLPMLTAAAVLSLPGTAAAQIALDRPVGPGARNEIIQAYEPFRPDGLLMLLPQLARATGVPMGLEVVKGGDIVRDESAIPAPTEVEASHPLTGMTLRDALDLLVRLDPRYEWREMRGVVVVRPREAWAEATHPLHRLVSIDTEEFWLEAALNYGTSLIAPHLEGPPSPPRSNRRFPLALRITVLEALNGFARGHGALIWVLHDESPEHGPAHMQLDLRPLNGELPASADWPKR